MAILAVSTLTTAVNQIFALSDKGKKKSDQSCSDEFVARYHRVFLWPILPGYCPTVR